MCSLANCFFCICLLIFCAIHGMGYKTPYNFHLRVLRTTESGCTLPEKPIFGNWSVYEPGREEWFPGKKLPSGKFIIVSCNDGYILKGSLVMNCLNNEWTSNVPKCLKKCPPLYNSPHLNVTCYEKKTVVNCSAAVEGVYAQFQCDRFYEIESVNNPPNYCSKDGTWKSKIPECVLTCGKNIYDDPTNINGGQASDTYAYPWQAAVYNKKDKTFMCGGSLIGQRIILTAAHCITKDGIYSKDVFEIAVGKYYSQHDHPQNETVQFSPVQEIFIPENYRGWWGKYKNDIALIVTKKIFTISEKVRPICIDWDAKSLNRSIKTSGYGFVTGWGFTRTDGNLSNVLNELKVPAIDRTVCMERLPRSFREYLTEDKLCAGYLNESKAACKGDSGGGLIFKNDGKYYISGVVSAGPPSPDVTNTYSCDNQQYGLYTTISYHEIFLVEKLAEAQTLGTEDETIETGEDSISACRLPEPPQFGYWLVNNHSEVNKPPPGQIVKNGTFLTIKCQDQHILSGSSYLICKNGVWNRPIGECLKTCPSIFTTKAMNVYCMYKSNRWSLRYSEDCINAIDGTLVEFKCAPFYEDLSLARNPVHICMNGKWDKTTPVCSPACGKLNDDSKNNFFPWHVAIYNRSNKNLICSGSLVNEKVIVTAAHCVTDKALHLKPIDTFLVTAGGRYRTFKDVHDDEYVQVSEVKHIFLPESNKKFNTKGVYYQDIAILVVKEGFEFTQKVLPICLDRRQVFDDDVETLNVATSGWGYNIDKDESAEILKIIQVSSDSLTICTKLFENYNVAFLLDKICLRQVNDSSMMCYGDSGAGLVYQHQGRYYLGGVRSLSPNIPTSVGACNRQEFAVYTNAFFYALDFILRREAEFRP